MTEHENQSPTDLLHELTDGQRVVMHVDDTGGRLNARPLTVLEHEPAGTFRFLVDGTRTWAHEGRALLVFQDDKDGRWVSASGTQRVVTDRSVIERLWNPVARAWFDGPDDPSLGVLEVELDEFGWWDSASNRLVRTVELVTAAVKGSDDGEAGDHGREQL